MSGRRANKRTEISLNDYLGGVKTTKAEEVALYDTYYTAPNSMVKCIPSPML